MVVAGQERGERRRPHPRPQQMSGPFLQFDLESEVAQMRREQGWNDGHTAKTLVKQDDFRVVLIALNGQGRLSEHKTDGRFSVHTVSGHTDIGGFGLFVEGLLHQWNVQLFAKQQPQQEPGQSVLELVELSHATRRRERPSYFIGAGSAGDRGD